MSKPVELYGQLDDETRRIVCQQFADKGDIKSLTRLIRTDKRNYKICNTVLEEMMKKMESKNPSRLSLDLPLKPELIDEDSGNRVMWDPGDQIDWTTVDDPDRIVLWGRKPFTISMPYLKEDDIEVHKTITLSAPLSLKRLVDGINEFYPRVLA